MTDVERAWLAGLLEGEGCFSTHGPKQYPPYARVLLSMTDEDVVTRAAELMGRARVTVQRRDGKKLIYRADMCANEPARALMSELLPLMGERRQARIKEVLDATFRSA